MAIVRRPSNIEDLSDDEPSALQCRPAAIDTLSDDEVPAISQRERPKCEAEKSGVFAT